MRFIRAWMVVLGLAAGMASAQMPTPQQLELLKSLSPGDRAALMEQLGISEGDVGTADGTTRRPTATEPGQTSEAARAEALERAKRELTFQPEDTVLVDIEIAKPKDEPGVVRPVTIVDPADQRFIETVRGRNPYQLDRVASLALPGLAAIPIGGLSEQQANRRLAADPALRRFEVKVTRLPVAKVGTAGLKPFGYDLFTEASRASASTNDIPAPADYTVGAGDQLTVQLFGAQNRTLRLVVGRDGRVNFLELGPVPVAGKKFDAVREDIETRVARQMIGTQASVGLGDTRSVSVFVMGEANKPGSYTVSGLSTITSALYASGGIKTTGSLRDVQLKRRGSVVRRLDLYDLLLRGDTSQDAKLQSGDVIFIPPVGPTVAVDGEVRRPAIYELRGNTPLSALVSLAGGLTPEADERRVSVVRRGDDQRLVALDLPLDSNQSRNEKLRNGDSIRVGRVRPTLDAGVVLEGHVFRPG
ncbi:MAG: SLBB domain-containing protein, partial [Gammaproteobacteria bacterium]